MHDQQAIQMMQRCREELLTQRRRIEALAPKAEAYDALCAVLDLLPKRSVGMTEDLTWRLELEIGAAKARIAEPAAADEDAA
ncbi:hypothetical protein [Methylobacterium fujisawaense]